MIARLICRLRGEIGPASVAVATRIRDKYRQVS